jgi:hypothetical protein
MSREELVEEREGAGPGVRQKAIKCSGHATLAAALVAARGAF